jgi:hypothetical protein
MFEAAANASSSVSPEAVAITAGAVVVAAVIAAFAAHKRLRMTLDAERERLDDRLAAEGERLEKQLQHDREQFDMAELRGLLDALMGDAWEAYHAALDVLQHHEDLLQIDADITERERLEQQLELSKARLRLSDACGQVLVNRFRAAARLPDGHAIVKAHNGVAAAVSELFVPDDPKTKDELADFEKGLGDLWDRHDKLIAACRSAIGSKL